MELKDAYTIVVTDRLAQTRDFYRDLFGFEAAFETEWFVYLTDASGTARLGLMAAGQEHQLPQHRRAHEGDSVIVTFEVADAAAEHARLAAAGAPIEVDLRDEPWGQRHFMLRDPAGVWVDVVQQIEPEPGFFSEAEAAALGSLASPEAA